MEQVPTSQTLDGVVLLLTILALLVGLVSMLVGWIHAHFFAHDDGDDLLSSNDDGDDLDEGDGSPLYGSAMGYNGSDNAPLTTPGNGIDNAQLDRMLYIERAKAVAVLYDTEAITNIAKAICATFQCSVAAADRSQSKYQRALAVVRQYSTRLQNDAKPKPPAEGEIVRTIPDPHAARGMNRSLVVHADGHGGEVVPTANGYVPLDEFLQQTPRASYEANDLEMEVA